MLTSVSVDALTAVYSALPSGLGLQLGMVRQVPNTNKFVQLVQAYSSAGASLKIGATLKTQGVAFTSPVVDMTSATGDFIVGVNDNAGVVIPAGYYFWMTISGPVSFLAGNGTTANTFQRGSATTGTTADTAAYSNTAANNLYQLAANTSGAAALRAGLLTNGA